MKVDSNNCIHAIATEGYWAQRRDLINAINRVSDCLIMMPNLPGDDETQSIAVATLRILNTIPE